jgi:hypothetical protein
MSSRFSDRVNGSIGFTQFVFGKGGDVRLEALPLIRC